MKRLLLRSNSFVRSAKRKVKENYQIGEAIRIALELLSENAFHPSLKTHKLKGKLEGSWACSAGYDLRIIFKFVHQKGIEAILLETTGTHDEVY